ncbi:MAG TPA: hypothetical protein VHV51_18060, partial [Polyangiaceae bacterium]|nr:hypothetical protein [Polyangiaceae bacterium]
MISRLPGFGVRVLGSGALILGVVFVGCTTKSAGSGDLRSTIDNGGSSSGGSSSSAGSGVNPGGGDSTLCVDNSCGDGGVVKPAGCGDGMLTDDEACDDGNL